MITASIAQLSFMIISIFSGFKMKRHIKILEVEDEVITALLMKKELTRIGYTVISHVSTGENAIRSVKHNRPDLILMDIRLAGEIDGIDTAFIINTIYDIPIIFMTGYDDKDIRARAQTVKPLGFFIKPIEISKLQKLINISFAD